MKKLSTLLSLLLVASMLLAACTLQPAVPPASSSTSSSSSSSSSSTSTDTTTPPVDPDEMIGVCINEVAGKNLGGALAPDGQEYDWIELYNNANAEADLSGWTLSNTIDKLDKFVFPEGTTIPAYGYLVVWAVGKDVTPTAPGHYAPFKVSSSGETIVLGTNQNTIKDMVDAPSVGGSDIDLSYARVSDAGYSWAVCVATPKKSNENSVLRLPSNLFTISADSGFYENDFKVDLSVEPGYTLKYTTDCSDPVTSTSALIWEGEQVHVYDPSYEPVRYSKINVIDRNGNTMWAPEQIDKCFVLRVAAVDDDGVATTVATRCYFVGFDGKEGYDGLPVVCLTSDPDGLYSRSKGGLFVLNNGESGWSSNTHDTRDWERQTNFSMFSPSGEYLFDQEVGIKVRGTSTRGAAQKSLNVYARAEYGSKDFHESVFPDRTRSLILRNDYVNLHHLGQGYLQDLVADRDLLTQRSYPVLVFIEGEYHGIYTLYERFNENFVEDRYGIADDNVWTAKKFAGSWGAEFDAPNPQSLLACQQDLNDILVYIRDHDMSKKVHYDYVCSKIDMDSLIDLFCFQLYIGNVDFSLAQNISAWRAIEVDPSNPYADGRWRFVVYDLDISMVGTWNKRSYDVTSNPFTDMQPWAGGGFLDFDISTCYFDLYGDTLVKDSSRGIRYDFTAKMMQSPLFCEQFVRTMEDMGNFNFAPERVKAILDEQLALIAPVYAHYRKRVIQAAYENPDADVDEQLIDNLMAKYNTILDYFNRRFEYISAHMAKAFTLKGTQNKVHIAVSGVDAAHLQINTTKDSITSAGMDTLYYADYALSLTALDAPDGFVFDHWDISGGTLEGCATTDSTITVTMGNGATVTITAVYVPAT